MATTNQTIHVVSSDVTRAAFDIAMRTGQPVQMPDGIQYAVIPDNCRLISLEQYQYSDYRERPHRKKAIQVVSDPASFLAYWNLFHDEHSLAFGSEETASIRGVLDYHCAGEGPPRWCQHEVKLQLRNSEEWTAWTSSNGKSFPQVDFGEFLENNASDITSPAPADMLEIARDLVANTDVTFESKVNMQSGAMQFTYRENLQASVGTGRVEVPQTFTIRIPVYVGMDLVDIHARLRFRISSGKLSFSYHLLNPSRVMRDAFRRVRRQIEDGIGREVINQ